ncbi:MAG: peptidase M64, partial [Gammaproteobacteria bacterium]|nr:peptidase M64 [Gammaproteobacteria bacterium]
MHCRPAGIAIFVVIAVSSTGGMAAASEGVRTMRLDFYHSGNHQSEMFSLDQLVLEPLAWPGNLQQPVDKTLRGKYAFEIVDVETGVVSWSRSFSSIYGEWETTGEAREMNRTFHESLRFPQPEQNFRVILKKRDH